eukprot:scaffold35254_cov21-Tisochrysis_lutea.AAC.2
MKIQTHVKVRSSSKGKGAILLFNPPVEHGKLPAKVCLSNVLLSRCLVSLPLRVQPVKAWLHASLSNLSTGSFNDTAGSVHPIVSLRKSNIDLTTQLAHVSFVNA